MRAEDYLQDIRDAKFIIDNLQKQREDIKYNIGIIRSSGFNSPVKGSPRQDKLERQVIRNIQDLERLDRKIADKRTIYIKRRIQCYEYIMQLKEGQCRRFLIDYYIDCKSENQISDEYHFESIISVYNLKRRAVRYFAAVYKKL